MDNCLFFDKNTTFCRFFKQNMIIIFYLYFIHFIISLMDGFFPYIKIPTR